MVEGALFIGTVIIAVTQALKELFPKKVNGAMTIAVSAVLGLLVALVDTSIGIQDLTVAQGILTALSASGVVAVAKKI